MRPVRQCFSRVGIFLALLSPALALGWGHQGHEYTGAIADRLLGKNAAAKVKQILGVRLEIASRWADCVKDVGESGGKFRYNPDPQYHLPCVPFETKAGIARMQDYVKRNWDACKPEPGADRCHKQYHYADVAIQHGRYDRAYRGTSAHDIVGAIAAAVLVLQDQAPPSAFSIKDKREALLLIAHFVGDLHQPLHVGSVYLDAKGKRVDPDVPGKPAAKEAETRGGNAIAVDGSNLHSEWDRIPGGLDPSSIPAGVLNQARAIPKSDGPVSGWPAAWASDSVLMAREAFTGVSFGGKKSGSWEAKFAKGKDKYDEAKETLQRELLVKGGARLAQLLNEIWP